LVLRWLQCTDTIQAADGIAILIGNDVVAPPCREQFARFRADIATDAETLATPTNHRRPNMVRTRARAHALNHGDAID
jgi:hypothetical protein